METRISLVLITVSLVCLALLPELQAVVQRRTVAIPETTQPKGKTPC